MVEPIRGEIVKILTKYSVLINVGMEHGVKRGMKFKIYEVGERIAYKGDTLGDLQIVKGEVEITNVQEKFSIGESKREIEVSIPSVIYGLTRARKEVLRIPLPLDGEYPEELEVPPIKVGDKVEQIL